MKRIAVVIMDDHPVVREGLAAILNREDDLMVVAESGRVCDIVPLVQEFKPDVIVLDTHMGQSTFGFVGDVKAANPHTGVLFFAALDHRAQIHDSRLFGASGIVAKEDSVSEVCRAVRRVAAGGTYISERLSRGHVRRRAKVPCPDLSAREFEVLCCVAHSLKAKEIAKNLKISVKTVDRHKSNIFHKLKIHSQVGLVRYAIARGFTDP